MLTDKQLQYKIIRTQRPNYAAEREKNKKETHQSDLLAYIININ